MGNKTVSLIVLSLLPCQVPLQRDLSVLVKQQVEVSVQVQIQVGVEVQVAVRQPRQQEVLG